MGHITEGSEDLATQIVKTNQALLDRLQRTLARLGRVTGAEIWVAAHNTPSELKQFARFVCDGTADEVEINQAFTDLTTPGSVRLLPGHYFLQDTPITAKTSTALVGSGRDTKVFMDDRSTISGGYVINDTGAEDIQVSRVHFEQIDAPVSGNPDVVVPTSTSRWLVDDCTFAAIGEYTGGSPGCIQGSDLFESSISNCRSSPVYHYLDFLGASGDYASTPDNAVLDIVGDLEIRAALALTNWSSGAIQTAVSKCPTTGSQRSYMLQVLGDGKLRLTWSEDGSILKTADSTVAVTPGVQNRLGIAVTLDVDNGASDAEVKFYTIDSVAAGRPLTNWTQLGSTVLVGATTSVFAGTEDLEIGARDQGTAEQMTGKFREAFIYDGLDANGGTLVTHPWVRGDKFFDKEGGLTYTLFGGVTKKEDFSSTSPSQFSAVSFCQLINDSHDVIIRDNVLTLHGSTDFSFGDLTHDCILYGNRSVAGTSWSIRGNGHIIANNRGVTIALQSTSSECAIIGNVGTWSAGGGNSHRVIGNRLQRLTTNAENSIIANNHIVKDATGTAAAIGVNGTVESVIVTGNLVEITAGSGEGIECNVSETDAVTDIQITDNIVLNAPSHGVSLVNADRVTVENNLILNAGAQGIDAADVEELLIANNVISATGNHGIQVTTASSRGLVVRGNQIRDTTERGIDVSDADQIAIVGNQLVDCGSGGWEGMFLNNCLRPHIAANYILSPDGEGIELAGVCDEFAIVSNYIRGSVSRSGINISGASVRGLIQGNQIIRNDDHGVDISGDSDQVSITGNWIGFNNLRGISIDDLSASGLIQGNQIRGNDQVAGGWEGIFCDGDSYLITGNFIDKGVQLAGNSSGVRLLGNWVSGTIADNGTSNETSRASWDNI